MVFVPPAQFPHRKKVADVMTTSKALRTRPRHMQNALWETVEPYVFLAPALIIFWLFLYYPFIRTIYLSLFLTDKYGMAKVFWGVGNYTSIFSDPSFWRSLTVTFEFVVMVAVGGLVVGLSPTLFFQVIINIIQVFQSFSQVKILTEGGPGDSANLIVYAIYGDAFFNYRFGTAAARSVILFVMFLIITLVQFSMEKRSVNY